MGLRFAVVVTLLWMAGNAYAAPLEVDDCGLEPPSAPAWARLPPKPDELSGPLANERPQVVREARVTSPLLNFGSPTAHLRGGALSGKTVYVSAGHGFTWTETISRWATQRGNTHDIVEDLVSTETISQFLIPMLLNAGAYVVPIRESDLNPRMALVDESSGDYSESGDAAAFSNSTLTGFGTPPSPLTNGTNPFDLGANRLMEATTSGTATASATWVINVPADGSYNLYISYTQFTYRVPDAHFAVKHAGGESHFRVNQRRHGKTWVLLGRFYFRQGKDAEKGAVTAFNDSSEAGNLSLDAIRIGGGTGVVAGNNGGTPSALSTRPRFEESARYSAQFLGAPPSVYDNASLDDRSDDVGTRSRFAAWDHEAGEDAVYVAWHTNACGDPCTARGTNTYVYGPNPPDGTYQFSGTAGSDVLAQHVHAELVKDLRSGWDPIMNDGTTWKDRGIKSAYFGELNPTHNSETPAILLEVAFHNTLADAKQIREPYFRYLAARAIAQGIIKYFAQKDGKAAELFPEPPVQLSARNLGNGKVRVSWTPAPTDAADLTGGAATAFRVYQSVDGFAWDDGTDATGTSFEVLLAPEQTRYFRVTGTNAGGESFPSETVGARTPKTPGPAPVLVVNAFQRFDSGLGRYENLSTWSLGSVLRIFVERMNDGSYARRHGFALAMNGVPFDSASASAVTSASVDLAAYAMVDWFAGRDLLSSSATQLLRTYVEAGGKVVLSGSHLASALSAGTSEDQQFLSQLLGASAAAAGGTHSVDGQGALEGLAAMLLDDGLRGAYPAGTPDVLTAGSASPLAQYTGTPNLAALHAQGAGHIALLSFPFEALRSEAHRIELMSRLLTLLAVPIDPAPYDGGTPGPDAGEPEPDAGVEPDGGTPVQPRPPVVLAPIAHSYAIAQTSGCGCGSIPASALAFGLTALTALLSRRKRR